MRKSIRSFLHFIVVVLLLAPITLMGQGFQTGNLGGQITDQTGAVLPGVTVEVKSAERGLTRSMSTDSQGRYLFPALSIGTYQVTAELTGFRMKKAEGNRVESERTTNVDLTLALAGGSEQITVTGETPIVDPTDATVRTRLSTKEFEKLPVGRSYQTLMSFTPGVMGIGTGGNPNSHGSLGSTNIYLFDGVDTTDTTTGTFGSNLNFEAIQEVNVYTSGVSAEYGRATGAILNLITKSGTNELEGSFKVLGTNDDWDSQNKTKNQVTGASLARPKTDNLVERYSATLGGPLWKDRAWFFGAYENAKVASSARQTAVVPQNYVQTTDTKLENYKLTVQATPSHSVFAKYARDPISGFVVDYIGSNTELFALTGQDQGGDAKAIQYSGVFSSNLTAEANYAETTSVITVAPYLVSPLHNGAPHFSAADGRTYNGGAFDGFVSRPRKQATVAGSLYTTLGGNSHNFKVGLDWQNLISQNLFQFPNNQQYRDVSFDPVTRTFVPSTRRDYVSGPSASEGDIYSLYARDKFQVGKRINLEVGFRFETEQGKSDIDATTVDTQTVSPRFSGTFDLKGDGKSLIVGSLGRFYEYIVQTYSDNFANVPQRAIYDNFTWNGTEYVFSNRVSPTGNAFRPNKNIDPTYLDEVTFGFQQQLGSAIGVGIRGIYRQWNDLIEDTEDFNPGATTTFRQIINSEDAERDYKAVELTFEKRFSGNWNMLANYTYSKAEGNHFQRAFTLLDDYQSAQCRNTVDPSIGTNGVVPCSSLNNKSALHGPASYDRPHLVNLLGGYSVPIGPLQLSAGIGGLYISGIPYSKTRTFNVLLPGSTTTNAGPTSTFLYEGLNSERLPAIYSLDASTEVTFKVYRDAELGVKLEAFNFTDRQEQTGVNNTAFCANTVNPSAACTTARNNHGTATARGNFQAPRSFRVTALVRF